MMDQAETKYNGLNPAPGLVSIVVPVFNVEKALPKCIRSILGQTYNEIELILVNDGSPDRSGEIIRDYAKLDSRITVIEQENKGVSSARNAGMEIAAGEYICFIDSDDYVSPEFISHLVTTMTETGADISACGLTREDRDGNVCWRSGKCSLLLNRTEALCALFRRDLFCGWTVNKLHKLKLLNDNGIRFDESLSICEDLVFNFDSIACAEKVAYDSRPDVYHYVVNPVSVNLKMKTEGAFDYAYLNRLQADLALEKRTGKFKSRIISEYCSANSFISNLNIIQRVFDLQCNDRELIDNLKKRLRKHLFPYMKLPGFGSFRSKLKGFLFAVSPSFACHIAMRVRK